eukprot:CAMPEP_0202862796 /NCGR_PEP_ID=MMETSP1391-20130828/3702_1 /ASSEMBLY_ACC=CAM_ASM_000867 /TAXON_ID=1034604 /ORGANISM="Chlamydomonas leiostraca, Strain SAG 11-49" /LENGTH=405 /DNA_ID=CAMNT_0049542373 /DNA_START=137 /DNA_END=1354 /DNA_ORIENTATION=-
MDNAGWSMQLRQTKWRKERQDRLNQDQPGTSKGSGGRKRRCPKLDQGFWQAFLALPPELSARILALAGWHMTRLPQFDALYRQVFADASLTFTWLAARQQETSAQNRKSLALKKAVTAGKAAVVVAALRQLVVETVTASDESFPVAVAASTSPVFKLPSGDSFQGLHALTLFLAATAISAGQLPVIHLLLGLCLDAQLTNTKHLSVHMDNCRRYCKGVRKAQAAVARVLHQPLPEAPRVQRDIDALLFHAIIYGNVEAAEQVLAAGADASMGAFVAMSSIHDEGGEDPEQQVALLKRCLAAGGQAQGLELMASALNFEGAMAALLDAGVDPATELALLGATLIRSPAVVRLLLQRAGRGPHHPGLQAALQHVEGDEEAEGQEIAQVLRQAMAGQAGQEAAGQQPL